MFRRNRTNNINNSNINSNINDIVTDTKAKAFDAIATSRQAQERLNALERQQQADGNKPTASETVEEKAKALMEKNPNLTFGEASSQVFRENPGLYERYRQQVGGRGY